MQDCLFCRIIQKKVPAKIIHEDDEVLAFEDINPQGPVHILVIPKKHIPTSLDIKPEDHALVGKLFQVAGSVARERGIAERGFRMVVNTNPDSGQDVYHLHLHIIGGRRMHWPPG